MITLDELKKWQHNGHLLGCKYCILFFNGEKVGAVYAADEDYLNKVLSENIFNMHIATLLLQI